MKIPNEIKVGNITYQVVFKDLKNKCLGKHQVSKDGAVITLEKDLSGVLLENVFFHELTHAIFYQAGVEDEEMVTQSIANVLQNLFNLKK